MRTTFRLTKRIAGYMALAAAVALAAVMLVPAVLGYERYVITGDSMSGTHDRGSILFAEAAPTSELRVGDVITYVPPPGKGPAGQVTHRIASIDRDGRGEPLYRTEGDANAAPDPWRFTLPDPTQARAVASVPYVGYGIAALAIKWVRMLVIGLPAALIAVALLVRLWRHAGDDAAAKDERGPERAAPALAGGGES
jgi:signal peptidase I